MLMIYLIDLTMNICNAIQRVKNDNPAPAKSVLWVSVFGFFFLLFNFPQVSVDIFNSFGYATLTRVWPGRKGQYWDMKTRSRPEHECHTLWWTGVVKRKSFGFAV